MLKVVLKGFGILLLCFGIGVPSYADYYFGDRTPRDVKYKLRKLDEARRRMKTVSYTHLTLPTILRV